MKQSALYAVLLFCGFRAFVAHAQEAPPYREALLSLHQALVEIPSVTNSEAEVGDFLMEYLAEQGLVTERQHIPSSNDTVPRFNVIAWPEDRPAGWSRVVVTSHIDTVPPHFGYSRSGPDPPTAETVIAGRGTVDAKGSVAAQIIALTELLSEGLITGDDVMLAFVVGEEAGGAGMQHFSNIMAEQPHRPRAAIFGEPTEGNLACGHKGILGCYVSATGRAGHSGYPESGKSANEVLMRALVKALDADLGSSERYGNTTINVGELQGGIALNVIPAAATAGLLIRVAIGPEATGYQIVRERLESIFSSVDDEAFEFECPHGYGAIFLECDVEGFETATMNYGTDIPFFRGNHTSYLYGPGSILVAHTPDEAITVGDLELAVEGFKRLILHAVGNSS
ncbi:hypothetical protein B0I35DRAFT_280254 [Stachybotrys elegans]|uniref:Peptidase M20 dimerisation domain-containing protein n=1 Tax=Stachybotrys elegans TaxID=80388 RepID=A0A8K0WQ26_9HYPO|nr:hypothetical protein B0I35DRAFT_280254 [Stachybotrys elegans]